jgi:hypothetical protein
MCSAIQRVPLALPISMALISIKESGKTGMSATVYAELFL